MAALKIREVANRTVHPLIDNQIPFNINGAHLCIGHTKVAEIIFRECLGQFYNEIEYIFYLEDGRRIIKRIPADEIYEIWKKCGFECKPLFWYLRDKLELNYCYFHVIQNDRILSERCRYCDTRQIAGIISCPMCGGPY